MHRRAFTKGLLTTVSSFALFDALFAFDAFGKNIKPIADHWAIRLNEICSDLKKDSITPEQWQTNIGALYSQIELE